MLTAEERKKLVTRRKIEYHKVHKAPDFAPDDGRCWGCHADLVEYYGPEYPTAYVTGCPKCFRSYCE